MKQPKLIILLVFLVGFCALSQPLSATEETSGAIIKEIKGIVKLTRADAFAPGIAKAGDILKDGDRVETWERASAVIWLEGVGKIELSERTTWELEKLRVRKKHVESHSYLALGELRARIESLPRESEFEVRTPTSIAAVRGTEFSLRVYKFGGEIFTRIDVHEDVVVFSNIGEDTERQITEGQSYTGSIGEQNTLRKHAKVKPKKPKQENSKSQDAIIETSLDEEPPDELSLIIETDLDTNT